MPRSDFSQVNSLLLQCKDLFINKISFLPVTKFVFLRTQVYPLFLMLLSAPIKHNPFFFVYLTLLLPLSFIIVA